MVSYHMALLRRLPGDFVQWLEQAEDPTTWAFFTERKLLEITKIADTEKQVKRLATMIEEAQNFVIFRTRNKNN